MFRLWLAAFTVTAVFTTGNTQANEKTLDSLITIALANNPQLKAADYTAQASMYESRVAGTLPDPTFSVGLMNLPRSSFALDEVPMSGVSLGLSQVIPWPGKLRAKARRAKIENLLKEIEVRGVRNRLIREVTTAYYGYSYAVLAAKIIKENIALINATIPVMEERYAQGATTAHDVLMAQTTGSRLEIRLLKAERLRQSALLELRRTVNDSSSMANLPPFLPEASSVETASGTPVTNPMFQNAELQIEKAQTDRSLAKLGYWPNLMLGASYLLRQKPADGSMDGENWLSLHVGVSLPLWFFHKQKNEARASEQKLLASRERARDVYDMLERELDDTRLDLTTVKESLNLYDRAILPQAKAGFEAAEAAYEVGRIDFDALLSAQMRLLEIELERLELMARVNQAKARLRELFGNNIER